MDETTTSNGREPASSGEPNPKAVGRRIALARKEAGGMTQGDLAELLQISKRSVAAYESGAVLPLRHLDRIEAAVSKPKAWLLYGDEALAGPAAILGKLEELLDSIVQRLDRMSDRVEQLPHERAESPEAATAYESHGAAFVDDLNRLVELRYQEMIDDAEFAAAKAVLFGLDRRAGS